MVTTFFATGLGIIIKNHFTHSIFSQIERAHDVLARLFAEQHLKIEITKVLVFTDPSAQIDIQGETGIVVKYLWEFCDWLQKLCTGAVPNVQIPWQKYLQPFIAPPYRPDVDFSAETDRILRPGIICPNCGSFKWQQYRYYLQCQGCGFSEAKETAYVRTICDYGVLFFHRNLKIGDLVEFFGEGYKKSYLKFIMYKYFELMDFKSRKACYVNKGIRFEYWFSNGEKHFKNLQKRIYWQKGDK